uniref:Uncharacterized protein n=1 Tax=Panagrolaimus sp. JU765 TaxID=591449 RepID=A0AC34RTC7_9BILA
MKLVLLCLTVCAVALAADYPIYDGSQGYRSVGKAPDVLACAIENKAELMKIAKAIIDLANAPGADKCKVLADHLVDFKPIVIEKCKFTEAEFNTVAVPFIYLQVSNLGLSCKP